MDKVTNNTGISLSVAAWLANDEYDHNPNPTVISATTLINPMRMIVLARQNSDLDTISDLTDVISSKFGAALHNGIEQTWKNKKALAIALKRLSYPDKIIAKIKVNPTKAEVDAGCIAVYMELRGIKKVGKYSVSGKFDFVAEGALEDFKSTGVYTYKNSTSDDKYVLQGSIYRWLHPDIITSDTMKIQFLFTDWKQGDAARDKSGNYPPKRIMPQTFHLMSIAETEHYVSTTIKTIDSLMGATQDQLPTCTAEELWQKPDQWKYYKNPAKLDRSTKNFDTAHEASARFNMDGGVGKIVHYPGAVMRCKYCAVAGICEQAQDLIVSGQLKLD